MAAPSCAWVVVLFLCCVVRAVSLNKIRDFMPKTNVLNHLRIDLDLTEILHRRHIYHSSGNGTNSYGTRNRFNREDLARRAYEKGGYACIYAELSLPSLGVDLKTGDRVSQSHPDGERSAILLKSAPVGSTQLVVEYNSFDRPCSELISANGDGTDMHVKGTCFDTQAVLRFEAQSLGVPVAVSHKFQTLAEFSTTAAGRMKGETEFELRRSFYGASDYAHLFVINALATEKHKVGQELVPWEVMSTHRYRSFMIKHMIVFMSVWMEVIHQMEKSISSCQYHDEVAMQAWEKAVSYYAGSSWNSGKSIMLDGQANDIGFFFGTFDDDRLAIVNNRIFKHFSRGQSLLLDAKCADLIVEKVQIVQQMYVPIVQNLLKNAFELSKYVPGKPYHYGDVGRDRADGALFAKIIQPVLHKCDSKLSDIVIDNMFVDKSAQLMKSGFAAVKLAIEASYSCIGITCLDIGGIWIPEKSMYAIGAEPCADNSMVLSGTESAVNEESTGDENAVDSLHESTVNHAKVQCTSGTLEVLMLTMAVVLVV